MILKILFFISVWICLSHAGSLVKPQEFEDNSVSYSLLNDIHRDLDHKLKDIKEMMILIDASIKALQEKAHVWDLYRHHIDAWNNQMTSLDHKIDLIKFNQENAKIIEAKLTSMEFTMNHILSQVTTKSDGTSNVSDIDLVSNTKKQLEIKHFNDIMKLLKENKIAQRDLSNRLHNVLRRVISVENNSCRSRSLPSNTLDTNTTKSANLMKPIGSDTDSILRNIEGKLTDLMARLKPKDLERLISTERKNTKSLDKLLELIQDVAQISKIIASTESENSNKFMNCCSSTMNELSTFTESSDLLLKRIERLVLNIQEKVDKVAVNSVNPSTTYAEEDGEENVTTELVSVVLEENTTYEEIMSTSTSNNPSNEIDTSEDLESTESVEADYIQPSKFGCNDLTLRVDGVYKFSKIRDFNKAGRDFNERYCTFPTDGAGWTVIQRRGPYDHQENFNRSWVEYRNGFGSLAKDFWFGNEFIHRLTYNGTYELRIELDDFDDVQVWAEYDIFQIDTEKYNYNLIIGGYRGAVTDSMLYHHMQDFSTYDRRNDKSIDECCPCATGYGSGWWYDNCSEANLNGIYHNEPTGHNYIGVVWEHWHGDYSLKKTRMLIRPTVISSTLESDENLPKEVPDDP